MRDAILILDDNAEILRVLGNYLRKREYEVHTVSSVKEAIKVIESNSISYAIMDLKIDFDSEFGGVGVIRFVKKRQPEAKVIVLSAYPFDDEIRSMLEHEIDDYVYKGDYSGNYALLVVDALEELHKRRPVKTCFVIMPMSTSKTCRGEDWTEIFNKLIKPAVEEAGYNYQCIRSEVLHGNIIEGIIEQLHRADLVIADLTDRNPNVFYELGVRHTLGGCTILITQNLKFVPFDLQHLAILIYDWRVGDDREKFKGKIKEVVKLIETCPDKSISPVRRYIDLIESANELTHPT
jgi:CheY-like chemotaxis protein